MMNKNAIEIRALDVKRGHHTVFSGFDLDIAAGKLIGLLGPSGCGKTTLMRSIVGAQRTSGGSVTVLGMPAGSTPLRKTVSYATQSAAVYDDLTVEQNLAYFARVLGAKKADVARAIADVDLTAQTRQRVESLSGGQRGRVSLAVAMLGAPQVLVLDEPTVGLDPLLRDEIWTTLRTLADGGRTILVSSHVMDEAMRCDEVVLMRDGKLVAQLTPDELLRQTQTQDADAAFLALIRRENHPEGQER